MEWVTNNPEAVVGMLVLVLEIVLRFIPRAKPITKLLYDGLGKVVRDKE